MKKLVVIAIGGNSLIEEGEKVSVKSQYQAICNTVRNIADIMEDGYSVVIAHGNGPQVGYILLRSEHSEDILHTVPLDSCVADTQGSIGYQLQMALKNELVKRGIDKNVVTVVTQVVVDKDDPSFKNPTKPIGSFMTKENAAKQEKEKGWDVKEDAGRGWRRVVASPLPKEIVEIETIKTLVAAGTVVIAVGGGGIPVTREKDGTLLGKEAVVDKDRAAAILAKDLNADVLLISTAVESVCIDYKKPTEKKISKMTVKEAEKYEKEGQFAPGSMLPKIKAVCDFVSYTSNYAIITDPANLKAALNGKSGTKIVK